jgi:PAS domain S-box-containing protein
MVDVNDSYLRLFGLSKEEAIGSTTSGANLFADITDRDKMVKVFSEQGYIRDYEVDVRDRSGRRFTVLSSSERIEMGGDEEYLISTVIEVKGINRNN